MANAKFQEIGIALISASATFIGVRDNGDGTYSDVRVTADEFAKYTREKNRKVISVVAENIGPGGTTLTDPFFLEPVEEIVANAQAYIRDVNFTQNTDTGRITGLDITFYSNQKIIARR